MWLYVKIESKSIFCSDFYQIFSWTHFERVDKRHNLLIIHFNMLLSSISSNINICISWEFECVIFPPFIIMSDSHLVGMWLVGICWVTMMTMMMIDETYDNSNIAMHWVHQVSIKQARRWLQWQLYVIQTNMDHSLSILFFPLTKIEIEKCPKNWHFIEKTSILYHWCM